MENDLSERTPWFDAPTCDMFLFLRFGCHSRATAGSAFHALQQTVRTSAAADAHAAVAATSHHAAATTAGSGGVGGKKSGTYSARISDALEHGRWTESIGLLQAMRNLGKMPKLGTRMFRV